MNPKPTVEPGREWYELYKKIQAIAIERLKTAKGPVETAHLALIELADWRWLARNHLRKPGPINPARAELIPAWYRSLKSKRLSDNERLVLAEAIIWESAAQAAHLRKPPVDNTKKQIKAAVDFVESILFKSEDDPKQLPWCEMLLAIRLLTHHGKVMDLQRLEVILPNRTSCEIFKTHLQSFVKNQDKQAHVLDGRGMSGPTYTLQAIECLASALMLWEIVKPKNVAAIRIEGRQCLQERLTLIHTAWDGLDEILADQWGIELPTCWWLTTVASRWYLADWNVFENGLRPLVAKTHDYVRGIEFETVKSATFLRVLAEGLLTLADAEPEVFGVEDRELKRAVRNIIDDDELASGIAEKIVAYVKSGQEVT